MQGMGYCVSVGCHGSTEGCSGAQLSPYEAAFNMVNQNCSSATDPGLAFQAGRR